MPDWITHIATAAVYPKRTVDFRLMLLGAVLPDAWMPLHIAASDLVSMSGNSFMLYTVPWHTPFMMLLVSLVIALFTRDVLRSWLVLSAFSLLHILFDSFVLHYGIYIIHAYPFYYRPLYRGFIPFNAAMLYAAPFVLLPSFVLIWKRHVPVPIFTWSWKRVLPAAVLVALVAVLPLVTRQRLVDSGYHYLKFYENPASFEGKRVAFCISRVTSVDPLTVLEMGGRYMLDTAGKDYGLKKGNVISFDGVYTNGVVRVGTVAKYEPRTKSFMSLFGLAFLGMLFLRSLRLRGSR
ncbi:MAG: hypothetical protein HZC28_09330 [Spirochaetes bacterium]|nr:hypothetical protein [Spirochaetota bacterium]